MKYLRVNIIRIVERHINNIFKIEYKDLFYDNDTIKFYFTEGTNQNLYSYISIQKEFDKLTKSVHEKFKNDKRFKEKLHINITGTIMPCDKDILRLDIEIDISTDYGEMEYTDKSLISEIIQYF